MKKSTIFVIFFLIAIVVTSGCTQSPSAGGNEPITKVQTTPSPVIPPTTPVPLAIITSGPGIILPKSPMVSATPTRIATDNPYLDFLQVRKKTFVTSIPNCLMENAFPAIVKDPSYGINQPTPKLALLSEEEYETFLRKYTEGKAENTVIKTLPQCINVDGEPRWNFVETRVILKPTNFKAANYTIFTNVRFEDKILVQFQTTKTLVLDQPVTMTTYIPLKMDEFDLFDDISVTYNRLTG